MPVCHLGRSLTVFKRSFAAAIGTGADWRRTISYSKHSFICPCCRLFSILPFLVSMHCRREGVGGWGSNRMNGIGLVSEAQTWETPSTRSTVATLRREDPASLLLALFAIPLISREPSLPQLHLVQLYLGLRETALPVMFRAQGFPHFSLLSDVTCLSPFEKFWGSVICLTFVFVFIKTWIWITSFGSIWDRKRLRYVQSISIPP